MRLASILRDHHLMGGFTTGRLLRLARANGLGPRPRQYLSFASLFLLSFWPTILGALERRGYRAALARTPVPRDPLIIVGHWRTGSTFLHQLLALHPDLTAPTLLQCSLPDCLLLADRFMRPVMGRLLASTRPMDNVRVSPREPMEDEFALFRLTGNSPLERLFFPRTERYFLLESGSSFLNEAAAAEWEEALALFLRKISLAMGKRIVLKNPFHSLRIPRLRRLFPAARFIHIQRDPREVIPSTMHMWTIIGERNCLRGSCRPPSLEETVAGFDRVLTAVRRDLAEIPGADQAAVRYEELEADPPAALRSLCARLDLPWTPEYELRVGEFLNGLRGYRKNSYHLSPGERDYITSALRDHLLRDGYL